MSFLDEMAAASRARAAEGMRRKSERDLLREIAARPPARGFAAALARGPGRRVIAEVKRASPSKGALHQGLNAPAQAARYRAGGAAAISVLTEPSRFAGDLADVTAVAAAVDVPVLRKDFLVDPWQVYEARAAGADAVLLIAELLPGEELGRMLGAARAAGVEALLELHDAAELPRALASGATVVGINARDLRTLAMDASAFDRLLPQIPADRVRVAESGIAGEGDLVRAERAGANAFLVGEALVRAEDPAATLHAWGADARGPARVKICGLTRAEDVDAAVQAGADFLGFNLWRGSKRYLPPRAAAALVSRVPAPVVSVGVFVHGEPEALPLAQIAGVGWVQVTSTPPAWTPARIARPVIRAVAVDHPLEPGELSGGDYYLLDAPQPGHGGGGVRFDASLAAKVTASARVFLAGGLSPDNVGEVARALRPFAVDVASGVESAPGKKDHGKMRAFVRAVHEATK